MLKIGVFSLKIAWKTAWFSKYLGGKGAGPPGSASAHATLEQDTPGPRTDLWTAESTYYACVPHLMIAFSLADAWTASREREPVYWLLHGPDASRARDGTLHPQELRGKTHLDFQSWNLETKPEPDIQHFNSLWIVVLLEKKSKGEVVTILSLCLDGGPTGNIFDHSHLEMRLTVTRVSSWLCFFLHFNCARKMCLTFTPWGLPSLSFSYIPGFQHKKRTRLSSCCYSRSF